MIAHDTMLIFIQNEVGHTASCDYSPLNKIKIAAVHSYFTRHTWIIIEWDVISCFAFFGADTGLIDQLVPLSTFSRYN